MSQSSLLELHVWGPAFDLPSFDANCLAAISYLHHALPDNSWSLVPSNPRCNPFRQLPALYHNGVWVAGFERIQGYLSHISNGDFNIDRDLTHIQKANCDAYTAFLYSRGLPLLDLSLYVSTENYTTCTRRIISEPLTWPQSWIVPHQLRDQAKRRSEHLGLSALDVDSAQEEDNEDAKLTANIPKSLRKPKQTVSGLLGRNAQTTRFRLDAAIEDFLEPLEAALAGKQWLVADHISSADCLAIAIVSLMQVPNLPQAWLHEALSNKYSGIGKWAGKHTTADFGNVGAVSDVMKDGPTEAVLPWAESRVPTLSWIERASLTFETTVNNIPIVRRGYERNELPEQGKVLTGSSTEKQQIYARMRDQQSRYCQIVVAGISATSLLGWMVHTGVFTLSRVQRVTPLRRSFGEAGAILGL